MAQNNEQFLVDVNGVYAIMMEELVRHEDPAFMELRDLRLLDAKSVEQEEDIMLDFGSKIHELRGQNRITVKYNDLMERAKVIVDSFPTENWYEQAKQFAEQVRPK